MRKQRRRKVEDCPGPTALNGLASIKLRVLVLESSLLVAMLSCLSRVKLSLIWWYHPYLCLGLSIPQAGSFEDGIP